MTIVGGTVSDATGGKFANGAVTAAFSAAVSEGIRGGAVVSEGSGGEPEPDSGYIEEQRVLNPGEQEKELREAGVKRSKASRTKKRKSS